MLSASRFPPLINDSPSFSKDVSGIVIILGEVESRVLSFVKWTFSTHHSVILSPAPLVILLEHYNFSTDNSKICFRCMVQYCRGARRTAVVVAFSLLITWAVLLTLMTTLINFYHYLIFLLFWKTQGHVPWIYLCPQKLCYLAWFEDHKRYIKVCLSSVICWIMYNQIHWPLILLQSQIIRHCFLHWLLCNNIFGPAVHD